MRGCIRWFNAVRGFGFITPAGSGGVPANDIFVHGSDVQPSPGEFRATLLEGELVEYEVGMDKRRRRCAVRVRRLPDQVGRTQRESYPGRAGEAPGGSRIR